MDNLPILIFTAVICLLIGILLTAFWYSQRGENPSKPDSKTQDSGTDPEIRLDAERGPLPSALSGRKEAARVWLDEGQSKLVVEMDGKIFHAPDEMMANEKGKFTTLLKDLESWSAGVSPQTPEPAIPAADVPFLEANPIQKPPKQSLLNSMNEVLHPKTAQPAEKSLASQVNDVLQEMIAGTPLAQRGLSLSETPEKGLQVMIGLEKYAGIDEVPDEAVRAAIHQAVDEWRHRTSIR